MFLPCHIDIIHIFIFMLFFAILGCQKEESSHSTDNLPKAIHLDLNTASILQMGELASTVEYIPLSTTPRLISGIARVKIGESIIVLSEAQLPDIRVLFFDIKGNHIISLESNQEGPGKFVNVNDFWINEDNKTVELLDYSLQRIIVYDQSGNYLSQKELNYNFLELIRLNEQEYVFNAGNKVVDGSTYAIHHYRSGEIISSHLEYPFEETTTNIYRRWLSTSSQAGNYLFHKPFDNSVYEVMINRSEVKVSKLFSVDFGGGFIDENWLKKYYQISAVEQMHMTNQSGKTYQFEKVDYLGSSSFLLNWFNHTDNKYWFSVASLEKGNCQNYIFDVNHLTNDINLGPLAHFYLGRHDDYLIFWQRAHHMTDHLNSVDVSKYEVSDNVLDNYSSLKNQFETLDPDSSNPILILYKLKQEWL